MKKHSSVSFPTKAHCMELFLKKKKQIITGNALKNSIDTLRRYKNAFENIVEYTSLFF